MGQPLGKYRTFAVAKAKLVKPDEKAVAAVSRAKSQFDEHVLNQSDLLATESILVSTGINTNDDVFLVEETWAARNTPVLKPANWMHNDKDIIGIMYDAFPVELDGKSIASDSDDRSEPFEILVKGAVYKYTFPDKAAEIEKLHAEGKLFVSMEAWFDSYDYALFDGEQFVSIIKRDQSTAHIDQHLKARGGTGKFNLRVMNIASVEPSEISLMEALVTSSIPPINDLLF